MSRADGRKADELRPVSIATGYLPWAEGSVMIDLGGTQVLCAATIQAGVPRFLRGSGAGWVTAEYSMLPRSTKERTGREVAAGRPCRFGAWRKNGAPQLGRSVAVLL